MTKKKGTIIFSIIISIVLLILAYLFGIIIDFSYNVLTSEFFFVVFSGGFASSLVVCLSEIFAYRQLKRSLENELFTHAINLFETVSIVNNMLKSITDNLQYQIPDNMLLFPRYQILSELNCLYNTDYNPFHKKQVLSKKLQYFKNKYQDYSRIITDCINFELAVSVSRLQLIKQNKTIYEPIYSTCPLVAEAILSLQKNCNMIINDCDELLTKIDYSGRFKWQVSKKKVQQNTLVKLVSKSHK